MGGIAGAGIKIATIRIGAAHQRGESRQAGKGGGAAWLHGGKTARATRPLPQDLELFDLAVFQIHGRGTAEDGNAHL